MQNGMVLKELDWNRLSNVPRQISTVPSLTQKSLGEGGWLEFRNSNLHHQEVGRHPLVQEETQQRQHKKPKRSRERRSARRSVDSSSTFDANSASPRNFERTSENFVASSRSSRSHNHYGHGGYHRNNSDTGSDLLRRSVSYNGRYVDESTPKTRNYGSARLLGRFDGQKEQHADFHPQVWTDEENQSGSDFYFKIEDKMYSHPPLPPGWELFVSDTRKKPYYVHPDHGTTWYCPVPLHSKRSNSRFAYIDDRNNNIESPCPVNMTPSDQESITPNSEVLDDSMSELVDRYDVEARQQTAMAAYDQSEHNGDSSNTTETASSAVSRSPRSIVDNCRSRQSKGSIFRPMPEVDGAKLSRSQTASTEASDMSESPSTYSIRSAQSFVQVVKQPETDKSPSHQSRGSNFGPPSEEDEAKFTESRTATTEASDMSESSSTGSISSIQSFAQKDEQLASDNAPSQQSRGSIFRPSTVEDDAKLIKSRTATTEASDMSESSSTGSILNIPSFARKAEQPATENSPSQLSRGSIHIPSTVEVEAKLTKARTASTEASTMSKSASTCISASAQSFGQVVKQPETPHLSLRAGIPSCNASLESRSNANLSLNQEGKNTGKEMETRQLEEPGTPASCEKIQVATCKNAKRRMAASTTPPPLRMAVEIRESNEVKLRATAEGEQSIRIRDGVQGMELKCQMECTLAETKIETPKRACGLSAKNGENVADNTEDAPIIESRITPSKRSASPSAQSPSFEVDFSRSPCEIEEPSGCFTTPVKVRDTCHSDGEKFIASDHSGDRSERTASTSGHDSPSGCLMTPVRIAHTRHSDGEQSIASDHSGDRSERTASTGGHDSPSIQSSFDVDFSNPDVADEGLDSPDTGSRAGDFLVQEAKLRRGKVHREASTYSSCDSSCNESPPNLRVSKAKIARRKSSRPTWRRGPPRWKYPRCSLQTLPEVV